MAPLIHFCNFSLQTDFVITACINAHFRADQLRDQITFPFFSQLSGLPFDLPGKVKFFISL